MKKLDSLNNKEEFSDETDEEKEEHEEREIEEKVDGLQQFHINIPLYRTKLSKFNQALE